MGERIVIARASQGLTQADLAERLGKSYQQVSQWERDEGVPRAKNLGALAEALGIEMEWLRTGAGPMLPPLQTPTFKDVAREPADPYTASPTLDLGLLTRALTAALSRIPQPTPEAAARAAVEATLAAQRTGKGERIADLVEVLLP